MAVRLGDRRHRVPDALSAVLAVFLLAGALFAAAPSLAFGQDAATVLPVTPVHALPSPSPVVVRPRIIAAYGALLAASMFSILYLYRGRAFIIYWLGCCILMAAALALASQTPMDARLGEAFTGIALLWMVWAAGLLWLGARAFPQVPLQWSTPLKVAAATSVWFLSSPFVISTPWLVGSGMGGASLLLALAAARYLTLARQRRHAGAVLIGAGLAMIAASNVAAVVIALGFTADAYLVNRLSTANMIISVFVMLGMHLLVFEDMTTELQRANRELEAANDAVKRLAITDALTGCHNRRFFEEIERREMQRHRRYGAPLSVVFADIDRFKDLNDSLGHDRGDDALRAIGTMLRRHVRESDYVIRWGGDEFLLLLTCAEPEAEAKAAELKRAFREDQELLGLSTRLGLSIGVAAVSLAAENLQDAIRVADARMYRDKVVAREAL